MTARLIQVIIPRSLAPLSAAAPPLFVPNAKAAERFFEFYTANIPSSALIYFPDIPSPIFQFTKGGIGV